MREVFYGDWDLHKPGPGTPSPDAKGECLLGREGWFGGDHDI